MLTEPKHEGLKLGIVVQIEVRNAEAACQHGLILRDDSAVFCAGSCFLHQTSTLSTEYGMVITADLPVR